MSKPLPTSRRTGLTLATTEDGLRIETAEGAVHELPPVTAAVFRAADGRTDAAGLLAAARAVEPTATARTVWDALDALGDAGLLAERAAPPSAAGLDRRAAIRTLAAAGAAAVLLPGLSRAAAAGAGAEQDRKLTLARSEEKAKADVSLLRKKAEEENAKASAGKGDIAALRKSESAVKAELDAALKKAVEETEKLSGAREEAIKANGIAVPDARRQEDLDKATVASLRRQEDLDKSTVTSLRKQEQDGKAASEQAAKATVR